VEAGCEIEDCVQDTMKRHISPKVAFQDPREFVSYKDAKECGGERRKRVQSQIIWVTQGKINGVENVLRCVARKPFLSVELV
jgi:hypothetical protein